MEPGRPGWEKDLERLRAEVLTQLKDWEDSQKVSITKQLESFRDNQAAELQKDLDICRRERDELFRECQTLRARERQLSDDLNETRLAFTRQTLDLQADKAKLLEELNTARSAPLLHQIKLLEELNAARVTLAEMTADMEDLKMLKSGRAGGLVNGPLKELRDELAKHGLSDAVVPQEPHAQVEARERLQELQRRWQTLKWTSEETYDIEGGCSAYELVGGMFIKIDGEGNILVLQLPTYRDPVYKVIANRNLGIKPSGFTSDPGQDLIVFTEISSE
ncbi:hypothetical protein H1R20_g9742, partial [Candolleomyces eurysporus]